MLVSVLVLVAGALLAAGSESRGAGSVITCGAEVGAGDVTSTGIFDGMRSVTTGGDDSTGPCGVMFIGRLMTDPCGPMTGPWGPMLIGLPWPGIG